MSREHHRPPKEGGPWGPVWHAVPAEEVLREVGSSPRGLSEEQARERLEEFGGNVLALRRPPSLAGIALRQFLSPLIYILLAAGALSLAIGDNKDALFIFAVVLINAGLGTFQEFRAEKSAAALQELIKVSALVIRDGVEKETAAEGLVPGDVVLLDSGRKVPADLRLLKSGNLAVDEALLTGESLAVEKRAADLPEDVDVAERSNMAFAGTTVNAGRGTGVVVATGMRTEIGRIAEKVASTRASKPPLIIRMERFSRHISFVVLGACAVFAVIAIARGFPYLDTFFMAVALMVSAIPEGLPVALTVVLSIGTTRMSRRNVIVRELASVESLGSCTCIATDKTGTLTMNRQAVKLVSLPLDGDFEVSGDGYSGEGEVRQEGSEDAADSEVLRRLARAASICNEAGLYPDNGGWAHQGDVVDVALLALGYKLGMDPRRIREETEVLGEIPFESERRYAAKLFRSGGVTGIAVKGAAERVLDFCGYLASAGRDEPVDRDMVIKKTKVMAEEGYRVIAVAGTEAAEEVDRELEERHLEHLTLLGLVGMIDPIRPEAPEAVEKCSRAGIKVIMVTGDHPATALAISREAGIATGTEEVVSGKDLKRMTELNGVPLGELLRPVRVFSRVDPLQKLEIVEALVEAGEFVAVTGDGVNDAPAMRRANIGVAMGTGTDVAKDASSIIVADDDFSSIVSGVEEGRFAYGNIRKVIYLLISTGLAEIILFILAVSLGMPLVLLPVQILWLNLVTNGIQHLGLAFEPGEAEAMSYPPRDPREGIFNRLMIEEVAIAGTVMAVVAFTSWCAMIWSGWEEEAARNTALLLMVLLENFHAFNCRSERRSVLRIPLGSNRLLLAGVLGALGVHVLAMYLPALQGVLGTAPVSAATWGILVAAASLLMLAMEAYKAVRRRSAP